MTPLRNPAFQLLALALVLALALPAAASQASGSVADRAYDNGFAAGSRLGHADARAGKPLSFEQTSAYRRATDGYEEAMADMEKYRVNYRAGFADGYKEGYEKARSGAAYSGPPHPGSISRPTSTAEAPLQDTFVRVPEGTSIQLRLTSTLSTRTSKTGDAFDATVTEPVYVPGTSEIAIPAGSTVKGSLGQVERPGRVSGTASLQLRYETISLPSGEHASLQASTAAVRDKESSKVDQGEGTVKGKKSTGRDVATVGGTTALGAIIGGIAGGGKGAAIGAGVGAAAGTGGVLMTRGKEIDLPSGTIVEIKLLRDLEVRR